MVKIMRESSLYIAIIGSQSELDNKTKNHVEKLFEDTFSGSAIKISDVQVDIDSEIIYEIPTPIVHDEILVGEFFDKLETILEELKEFQPHFTQFNRGGLNG